MIQLLTQANQSLLNQARSTDINSLQGLMTVTGQQAPEPEYQTVEEREMAAYREALSHSHEVGELEFDQELADMRSEL